MEIVQEARGRGLPRLAAWVALVGLGLALVAPAGAGAAPEAESDPEVPFLLAWQEDGKLEPRYQPREPEPEPWFNSSYVFAMTRGVASSTIHPAGKAPLFLFTVPLDIVFLPFSLIGGIFG